MIKIDFKLPNFSKRLRDMKDEISLVLAATMQTNRAMMFDKDGADNGKPPWAPLTWRKGRPLQKTGTLRKSMAPPQRDGLSPGLGRDGLLRIAGNRVTIGTALGYARMMNDGTTKMPGGVLKPVTAMALRFPAPEGSKEKFMFRKSVRIPARPMDTVTEQDKKEWADTLSDFIAYRLREIGDEYTE